MAYPKIFSYEDAWQVADQLSRQKDIANKTRLLLGNGFSKAYYGDFGYTTLFDAIKDEKENDRICEVFEKFGNSNFEGVLRLLQHAAWLVEIYGFSNEEIIADYERVKSALAEAIVKVHPLNTAAIPPINKVSCHDFISSFADVFTVNYDLLLYWVVMQNSPPSFGDCFTREEDTPDELCEYEGSGSKEKKFVYYLHGALHLVQKDGKTFKRVWGNTVPLVSQVKGAMDNGEYPLVVAEGDHESKDRQMSANPYLKHAYDKLKNTAGQIFTFGFSFSDQDEHLLNAISWNGGQRYLWVGIRGDFTKSENQKIFEKVKVMQDVRSKMIEGGKIKVNRTTGDLKVSFYDTGTMDVWGNRQS